MALGTRADGGPTTWQAAIITPNTAVANSTVQSHTIPDRREFYFEMSDFQHAYEAGKYVGANEFGRTGTETAPVACTFGDCFTAIIQPNLFNATEAFAPALANTWKFAVNPPLKLKSVPFPDVVTANAGCPGPNGNNDTLNAPRPCAEAINIAHSSLWVVN